MTSKKFHQQYSRDDFTIKAQETKYQGFFRIEQYQLRHRLFNGHWSSEFSREIFERGDAVVVIPFDPVSKQLLLIEQFRPGAIRSGEQPWLLEFIAGMFDEDESAIDVAIREAEEEAKLKLNAEQLHHVMDFLSSPGGTSEKLYLYVALVDSSEFSAGVVAGLEAEHEDIRSHMVSLGQALQWLNDGIISNASTIIGLQWLALNHQTLTNS